MLLDPATQRDLEVFATRDPRGVTLWSLLDRTHSRAASEVLRQRLLEPRSGDEIVALQEAHRCLAGDAGWASLLSRIELDAVEAYLSMRWQHPAAMPRLAPLRAWYRDYRRDVDRGRSCVHALLADAAVLAERLLASAAPALRAHGEGLAGVRERLEARGLGAVLPRTATRTFDQLARVEVADLLRDVIARVSAIDAMWSLGTATAACGWTYPQPSAALGVTGLVHPALGADAVGNDLALSGGARVCFVTGPNMAGKSTFMKALALAMALAHAGCGVPATTMTFPVVSTVLTAIDVSDRLASGESFYLSEVRRIGVLAAALQAGRRVFAVLDEPFRGTNVHDATEATREVLLRLASHPGAWVFVASHLTELAPALEQHASVSLLHFSADVTTDDPHFDFRIRPGVSSQRLGMTLLRRERVLDLLEVREQE